MNLTWLMRMARWARRPPSLRQVQIAGVVLLIAVSIWGLDKAGLWPDWARMERAPKAHRLP